METTIDNHNNDFMPEPARPQFLSVLCILTWVCCGLIFISTLWGIIFQPSAEEQAAQIEQMEKISPEAAEQMQAAFESQTGSYKAINTSLTLVAVLLCSLSAWMMWNLKKKGFHFYLIGEIIPYLGFLFGGAEAMGTMGAMTGMSQATVLGMVIGVMALFDGIFIAMYASNLKYLKD